MAAVILACASCVKTNTEIGSALVPKSHTYTVHTPDAIPIDVELKSADDLSGFSTDRITIGSIRKDDEFGLTRHYSALWLIPIVDTTEIIDYGENPVFKQFHFTAVLDSTSVADKSQSNILQNVNVYELSSPIDLEKSLGGNTILEHGSKRITNGIPVINGGDSLSFDFSEEYGKRYMDIQPEETGNFKAYIKKFPGIFISTNDPKGDGGRFNIFQLQMDYTSSAGLEGSYAQLKWQAEYDGRQVDTSMIFYFSATNFYDVDSLLNLGTGSFPQCNFNMTEHDATKSKALEGEASDIIYVEGGGGIKPVISGVELRNKMRSAIEENGDDPDKAIINRASLYFYFEPSDDEFELMYKLPEVLSPTCRIQGSDYVTYMGLTDASDSNEDQGDINRSQLMYSPDITYHAQELMAMKDDASSLTNGNYDIWLLIMHNDEVETTTSGNSELSDYYKYLAYSSYYNSMYSGYGSGSYGYSSYSNYYNYQMLAAYYGSSSTSTSVETNLDRDRYYYCKLYGPSYSDKGLRPVLQFTYSIPNK